MRNIRQNLFFAFIYNLLGVPIAAGVLYPFTGLLLQPIFAAAAMSFSSVSVIANALRLRKARLGGSSETPTLSLPKVRGPYRITTSSESGIGPSGVISHNLY